MDKIAVSLAARGVLCLVTLHLAMTTFRSVLAGSLALAIATLVVLLTYDFTCAARVRSEGGKAELASTAWKSMVAVLPRWNLSRVKQIFLLGMPLGITSLLLALAISTPRYFLQRWQGEQAVGYFTALAHPTAAFSILLSAFGQAATPRMADFYRSDRRRYHGIVVTLLLVPIVSLVLAVAILQAVGPDLLGFIYRDDYAEYHVVFMVLIVSGAAWAVSSVLGYAATASGRLRGQAGAAMVISLSSALVSALAIPLYGLIGAAAATLVGGVVSCVTYWLLLLRESDD
jgi:O-antigen/teichoic acid export membrane protein